MLNVLKPHPVTLPEFYSHNQELPDVIGFKMNESVVVECKISRNDFLADKKKPFRVRPDRGMGDYRYYCCPKDLIHKEELPLGWGLLYVYHNGLVRRIKESFVLHNEPVDWQRRGRFDKDKDSELNLLFYYARRAYYAGVHKTVLEYRGYDG